MNQYYEYVEGLKQLLKERKVCWSSRNSHETCYTEFGRYLETQKKSISYEVIRHWLIKIVKKDQTRQAFHVYWKYMEQLDEFITTGTVINDHLLLTKPSYDKLPESWRELLDTYLDVRSQDYTTRSFKYAKTYTSEILLTINEHGASNIQEVSYCVLIFLYEDGFHCTKETRYILLSHARQFFDFCKEKRLCPAAYSMILDNDVFPYVAVIERFSAKQIERIRYLSQSNPVCNANETLGYLEEIKELYHNNDYSYTILQTVSHTVRTLYVFLSINELNYNPEIASIWYDVITPIIGNSCMAWRRVLAVLGEYISGEKIFFDKKYFPKIDRMANYPDWCKSAVEDYFDWLIRSFHEHSTVRAYKYNVFSLCDYILAKNFHSFDELTIDILKEFLQTATHATFRGYSTRVANIRRFVTFLEDNDFITLKNIHLALNSRVAKEVKIVDVLSDIEIEDIYKYKETSKTFAELRNTAMVLIGLRMGLRSSDVINLKMTDIHWKESIISVVQTKTRAAITLPLPADVGNAIYAYIKYARPKVDNEIVFLKHKAPYGKLTNKICNNALYTILPERRTLNRVGFHSLRRTFATSILRRNAGIEAVIDSLGHQDNTTVIKYLSFDEEKMIRCSLSLSECNISLGGDL